MPIQFCETESVGYWGGEGELDSSSFLDELEFYTTTSSSSSSSTPNSSLSLTPSSTLLNSTVSSIMGATSAALIPASDSWCKTEVMDEESFLSMSPPDPFKFTDWGGLYPGDEVVSGDEIVINSSSKSSIENGVEVILIHDCMWAGGCSACEHEARTLVRQSSTCSSSSDSDSSCSHTTISSNSSSISNCSTSNINDIRTGPPCLPLQQSKNNSNKISSSTCSSNNTTATSSCNSNNNSNTNSNNNSCSNSNANSSSCSPSNNNISSNSSSVVQTIEVPSVCGQSRRTGVIVQKTVGRSLLIKSRTKSENNSTANNVNNSCNVSLAVKSNNNCSTVSLISSNNNNINNRNNLVVSCIPTPPITNSRPETPQSLSESEDDTLDLSSVFLNIDNLKPPQGCDLWDEVWAAVEEEHASGIEIPSLNTSSSSNDSNNNKISSPSSNNDDLSSSFSVDNSLVTTPIKVEPPSSPSMASVVDLSPPSTNLPDNIIAAATTVVSDHSYDKRAWIRLEDLGVQTPSDSEDEIDVVSLVERSRAASRSSSTSSSCGSSIGLPTNPSAKDQEEIQVLTTSKLLHASRAVSRRLKSKIVNRNKVHHHSSNKRRLSDFDEYKTNTRLSKKPRIHHKGKSRFATDSESDSKEKRDMHNNMERMRRIDLRNSFDELKALVPSLVVKERAPKVQILQEAASYCTELKFESRKLATQVAALRKEQERLRGTVSGLRRSLAAHR